LGRSLVVVGKTVRVLIVAPLVAVVTSGCGAGKRTVSGYYFNRSSFPHGMRCHGGTFILSAGRLTCGWCPKLTVLSDGAGRAHRGEAITAARVGRINARYQREILRDCPGVVSVGVSDAAIIRGEQQGKRHLPPASQLHEPVIAVGVKAKKYLPRQPVFLHGVPVLFQVTGPAHLDSSATGQTAAH
jgi:hypothetical protein